MYATNALSESISSRIPKETLEVIDTYADSMRYYRSQAVRVILEDWVDAQSEVQPSNHRGPSESRDKLDEQHKY